MDLFYLSIILLLLSWRVISHMASRKLSKMKTWCYLFQPYNIARSHPNDTSSEIRLIYSRRTLRMTYPHVAKYRMEFSICPQFRVAYGSQPISRIHSPLRVYRILQIQCQDKKMSNIYTDIVYTFSARMWLKRLCMWLKRLCMWSKL